MNMLKFRLFLQKLGSSRHLDWKAKFGNLPSDTAYSRNTSTPAVEL